MSNQTPSYMQNSQSRAKLQLNNEEIQHLLNKISSDEQKELTEIMRTCTSEVAMTRGLPISAAILGSLYFARTRLPTKYHFGPKGWPFYAIMGIGSMTVVNLFSMGMCRDRIQPKIEQLWTKYQNNANSQNYDSIRAQHRTGVSQQSHKQDHQHADPAYSYESSHQNTAQQYIKEEPMSSYSHDYHSSTAQGRTFDLTQDSPKPVSRPLPPQFIYDDAPTYMSGTPSGSKRNDF